MKVLSNLKGYDIRLMSKSPRRRQLLASLGLAFTIGESHIDETYPDTLVKESIPMYLSLRKAMSKDVVLRDNTLIIAADTIVWNDGQVLGKPQTADEACAMLRSLSGHSHSVVTGVTLRTRSQTITFSEESLVAFDHLTDDEIAYYVEQYRPLDKAGAYGIQEWIGMMGVKGLQGCYYNVMGLPMHKLYRALCQIKPLLAEHTF